MPLCWDSRPSRNHLKFTPMWMTLLSVGCSCNMDTRLHLITISFAGHNYDGQFMRMGCMLSCVAWRHGDNIWGHIKCRNPSFGLATKAKGLQGCGPTESPGVTSHTVRSVRKCEGVNPHTPKATPTLGDGVSVDSRNFKERFQGSKLNDLWISLYHWKDLET